MDILILGGVLMKKIIRDFVLLFVLCFLYMTFSKIMNVSAVEGLIISLGSAAIFSLLISMIRNLNEEDLNLKINLPPKEVEIIRQSRLVLRDSIFIMLRLNDSFIWRNRPYFYKSNTIYDCIISTSISCLCNK